MINCKICNKQKILINNIYMYIFKKTLGSLE